MSEPKKIKGTVDLVFLIDVTGSMQPCIDGLKNNIKEFFNTLQGGDANNPAPIKDWRAKVVGYRDYEDDPSTWYEDNDFTRDVDTLYRQLDALEASGGGDMPESLLDALCTIAKAESCDVQEAENPKKWRYRKNAARAVIAFTDAPFKETMSAPGCEGGTVDDVINAVMDARILLTVITPYKDDTGAVMDGMNTLAEADKAEYIPLRDGDESVSLDRFAEDKDRLVNTLKKLAATLSRSVQTETL